jgi:hypothetical protein
VVNCSPIMSAFNVSVTDKLPDNVAYDQPGFSWNGNSGGTWYTSKSATGAAGSYATGTPTNGQTTPYFQRFVLDQLGPAKSAYIKYSVVIL